jgi:hypothetical protein
LTKEEYAKQYYEELLRLHNEFFFDCALSKVYCIDGTSNSRRTEVVKTLNIEGGKFRKLAAPKATFTDWYVAAFWMDGFNRTPAIMYSHNKVFKRGTKEWNRVLPWLKEWDIEEWRIRYCEPEKKDKKFCAASKEQIIDFKEVYKKEVRGTRVLRDDGNEYKLKGQDILADSAEKVHVFKPEPHGELSPADNHLFGTAKIWCRAERKKYCGDDMTKQSVFLLCCIDCLTQKNIQGCFTKNFFLGEEKPTLAGVESHLRDLTRLTITKRDLVEKYEAAHTKWLKDIEENPIPDELDALEEMESIGALEATRNHRNLRW